MAQILLPTDDIETVGWTTTPLWSTIDDPYPGGSDRIQSSSNPANVDFEVGLAAGSDPGTNKGHRLKFRLRNGAAATAVDFTFEVKQGAAVIATGVQQHTTTTDTWYSLKLSEAEAANITNYADLSVRCSANKVSGGNVAAQVEALHLEIPDVGSCVTAIPGGIAASKIRTMIYPNVMGHANNDTPANLQDESGNGHSLVVNTAAATFKTNVINGLSVVEFDGVNDSYRMFWPSAAERITYFHAVKHLTIGVADGQDFCITSGEVVTSKVMLGHTFGNVVAGQTNYLIEQAGVANHCYFGANTLDTTAAHVLRTRYDTVDRFWDGGVERTDFTPDTDAGSLASTGCKLGCREDDTRFWHGQLAFYMVGQGATDQEESDAAADIATILASGGAGSGAGSGNDENRMGGTGAIRRPARIRI